jgi:hypothetical protein
MINVPPASFRLTPYGEVDAVALENLRDSFDTSQLLRLVDRLDVCLWNWVESPPFATSY